MIHYSLSIILLLLSSLLNLASLWSFIQGFSAEQRALDQLICPFAQKQREKIRENKKKRGGGQTHSTVSLAEDMHNVGQDKYNKTVTLESHENLKLKN